MEHQLNKIELAKLYREFSRQKYKKYRHQFLRMRQSELVSKIIMGGPQYPKKETTLWPFPRWKTHLQWKVRVIWQKSRQEEEALSRLKEKKKPNLKVWARAQASQVKVVKHHQRKAAVWECSFNLHHQRNKRPGYNLQTLPEIVKKNNFDIIESYPKETGVKASMKKKIKKQNANKSRIEYIKFFKFNHDKLSTEHKILMAS